jgi:hypothetical protein
LYVCKTNVPLVNLIYSAQQYFNFTKEICYDFCVKASPTNVFLMQTKNDIIQGQASQVKMVSSKSKLTALACHQTQKVSKAK